MRGAVAAAQDFPRRLAANVSTPGLGEAPQTGPSQKTLRRHEVRWYRRILSLKNTQMARGILGERAAARSFDVLSLFRS